MSRRLWVASGFAVSLLVVSVFGLILGGIWLKSDRAIDSGAFLIVVSLVAVPAFAFWTADFRPPPNLPRATRKRLRAEEARIRYDAEIAHLEREAGIR